MTIAITMSKLLFAMAVGFFLRKSNIFDRHVSEKLSKMIVTVTCPILILSSASSVEGGSSGDVIFLLVAGAAVYVVMTLLSLLICKVMRVPHDCQGTYRCMYIFANCSFMGYPVVEALYGSYAIFYTTIFHFGFNILFFSYGIYLISKDAGAVSSFEPKRLINTGTVAGVLALVIYFTGFQMPEIIGSPLSFVGNITTPLSMVVIGSNMAGYKLGEVFKEKKTYLTAVIRLVIIPLVIFLVMRLFTSNAELLGIMTVTMGMPVASLVAMASSGYEKQGKIASLSVVVTTILSMATIPIMVVLLKMFT